MKNTILDEVINSRKGLYVHAIEVEDIYSLQSAIEALCDEFRDREKEDIKEFINTLQVYCLEDRNENEVYNFNVSDYLNELLD